MKVDLNGRVAIVTGGGGAIGSAMCEQLAANGAKVVVAGRTLRTLEVSVDLNGVYYCSKYAIRQMIRQGRGGSIINVGSIVGLTPLRLQCAFTAAKAGVFNLTKTMALECAPHGIRVNGIAPGSIMFEGTRKLFYADPVKAEGIMSHIPQHQPGEPNDIAWATCFLASDEAKYMTGSVMTIDGGWICGYNREL